MPATVSKSTSPSNANNIKAPQISRVNISPDSKGSYVFAGLDSLSGPVTDVYDGDEKIAEIMSCKGLLTVVGLTDKSIRSIDNLNVNQLTVATKGNCTFAGDLNVADTIDIKAANCTFNGKVKSGESLDITVEDTLRINKSMICRGELTLSADKVRINQALKARSLDINGKDIRNDGSLSVIDDLRIKAEDVFKHYGALKAGGSCKIKAKERIYCDHKSSIVSKKNLRLESQNCFLYGKVSSQGIGFIRADKLDINNECSLTGKHEIEVKEWLCREEAKLKLYGVKARFEKLQTFGLFDAKNAQLIGNLLEQGGGKLSLSACDVNLVRALQAKKGELICVNGSAINTCSLSIYNKFIVDNAIFITKIFNLVSDEIDAKNALVNTVSCGLHNTGKEQATFNGFNVFTKYASFAGRLALDKSNVWALSCFKDLLFQPVPADGHCLFHAIGMQAKRDYQSLRRLAVDHIRSSFNEFSGFIDGAEEEKEKYLVEMRDGNSYGGESEIIALSNVLQRSIIVVDLSGKCRIHHEIENAKQPPIFLLYSENNHYNALLPRKGVDANKALKKLVSAGESENLGSKGNIGIQHKLYVSDTMLITDGQQFSGEGSEVDVTNSALLNASTANFGDMSLREKSTLNGGKLLQSDSSLSVEDSKALVQNDFIMRNAKVRAQEESTIVARRAIVGGELTVKDAESSVHIADTAHVLRNSKLNIKDDGVFRANYLCNLGESFALHGILDAKKCDSYGRIKAKDESQLSIDEFNIKHSSTFSIKDSELHGERLNIDGATKSKDAVFDIKKSMRLGYGVPLYIRGSRLKAGIFDSYGDIICRNGGEENEKITSFDVERLNTHYASSIIGDDLQIDGSSWDHEGNLRLSGGLVSRGKMLNNYGSLDVGKNIFLGYDYWVCNTGGTMTAKDIEIQSNLANVWGKISAVNSLHTVGLVNFNAGLLMGKNISQDSFFSYNAGLILPNIAGVKDMCTVKNGIYAAASMAMNYVPKYISTPYNIVQASRGMMPLVSKVCSKGRDTLLGYNIQMVFIGQYDELNTKMEEWSKERKHQSDILLCHVEDEAEDKNGWYICGQDAAGKMRFEQVDTSSELGTCLGKKETTEINDKNRKELIAKAELYLQRGQWNYMTSLRLHELMAMACEEKNHVMAGYNFGKAVKDPLIGAGKFAKGYWDSKERWQDCYKDPIKSSAQNSWEFMSNLPSQAKGGLVLVKGAKIFHDPRKVCKDSWSSVKEVKMFNDPGKVFTDSLSRVKKAKIFNDPEKSWQRHCFDSSWSVGKQATADILTLSGFNYSDTSLFGMNSGAVLGQNITRMNLFDFNAGVMGAAGSCSVNTIWGRNSGAFAATNASIVAQYGYKNSGSIGGWNRFNLSGGKFVNTGNMYGKNVTIKLKGLKQKGFAEFIDGHAEIDGKLEFTGDSKTKTENMSFKAKELVDDGELFYRKGYSAESHDYKHTGKVKLDDKVGKKADDMFSVKAKTGSLDGEGVLGHANFNIDNLKDAEMYDLIYGKNKGENYHVTKQLGLETSEKLNITGQNFRDCGLSLKGESIDFSAKFRRKEYDLSLESTKGDICFKTDVGAQNQFCHNPDVEAMNVSLHSARDINTNNVFDVGDSFDAYAKRDFNNIGGKIDANRKIGVNAATIRNITGYYSEIGQKYKRYGLGVYNDNMHARENVSLVARDGNIENHGGGITAGDYCELSSKGSILNVCYEYKVNKETRYREAIIKGGKGTMREDGIGVFLKADDKVIIDGSIVGAEGDTYIDGKNGIECKERHHQYVSGTSRTVDRPRGVREKIDPRKWKGWNPFIAEVTHTKTESTKVHPSRVYSNSGRNLLRSEDGGVTAAAASFFSEQGTEIDALKKVSLYSLGTQENIHVKKYKVNWPGKSKSHETHAGAVPTVFIDNGLTKINSDAEIDARGALFLGKGALKLKAPKVNLGLDVLNHSMRKREHDFGVSFFGLEALRTWQNGGTAWQGLRAEDATLNKFGNLFDSDGFMQGSANAFNLGVDLTNLASSLASGVNDGSLGGELLQRYGLGGGANGFNPTINFSHTYTETDAASQSVGAGGIFRDGEVDIETEYLALKNGFTVNSKAKVKITAKEMNAKAAELHFSTTQKSTKQTIGVTPTGEIADVGLGFSRSKLESIAHVNAKVNAPEVELNIGKLTLDGARITTEKLTGKVEQLNVKSRQDSEKSSSVNVYASTAGSFSAGYSRHEKKRVNEASGIEVTGNNDNTHFVVDKTKETTPRDHAKSSQANVRFNAYDLAGGLKGGGVKIPTVNVGVNGVEIDVPVAGAQTYRKVADNIAGAANKFVQKETPETQPLVTVPEINSDYSNYDFPGLMAADDNNLIPDSLLDLTLTSRESIYKEWSPSPSLPELSRTFDCGILMSLGESGFDQLAKNMGLSTSFDRRLLRAFSSWNTLKNMGLPYSAMTAKDHAIAYGSNVLKWAGRATGGAGDLYRRMDLAKTPEDQMRVLLWTALEQPIKWTAEAAVIGALLATIPVTGGATLPIVVGVGGSALFNVAWSSVADPVVASLVRNAGEPYVVKSFDASQADYSFGAKRDTPSFYSASNPAVFFTEKRAANVRSPQVSAPCSPVVNGLFP